MRMKKALLGCILLLTISTLAHAQLIQTGRWRTHLSYKNALICEASNRYVYAASQQGFFRVMMNYGDMEKLGKEEGFAYNEVTTLAYNGEKDILLIGYSDGNIDLLQNDRVIFNIPGFKNKLLQGDKRILSANFHENEALISTYFGLLVVDLDNHEINDSYSSIGPNGTAIPVLSSAVVGDSIYIGTSRGVRFAKWSKSVNLNDYTQWQWAVEDNRAAKHLTEYNGSLLFELDSMVYQWTNMLGQFYNDKRSIARIWTNQFGTHIARQGEITTLSKSGNKKESINLVSGITRFKDGIFWFCTGIGPGVIKKDPNGEIAFLPDGPADPSIFRMTQNGADVLATAGGVSSTFGNAFNNAGFYLYRDGGWKNNLPSPLNTNLYDFTFVQYIKSRNWYMAATHSNGILVIKDGVIINRYDETNSPLKRQPPINLIKVSGIAEDSKGNIWIAAFGADEPLFCLTKQNQWKTVAVPAACREVKDLSVDYLDRKWMILQTGGIQVFDEGKSLDAATDDRSVYIGTQQGLISTEVLSVKCDELGYTWIGTNQGLNVYSGASTLFSNPKVDRYIVDQDGNVGYLMGEETINDICVDGGGRKWMATNNGLFLVEPYGQRVIKHFNIDNSPLLSNRIICIGQNTESGEIFAGTDKGIISYRSDANEAAEVFEKIKVYPNPVPPKYDGLVTIEGLTSNAEVKIVDITGKLVFQTKANGGKATWNGFRLDGSKPNSGLLFVFAINTDGTETAMGKFIYIRGDE